MSLIKVINEKIITKLHRIERFQNTSILLTGTYFVPYIKLQTLAAIFQKSTESIKLFFLQLDQREVKMFCKENYTTIESVFFLLKEYPYPEFEDFLTKKILPLLFIQQIEDRKALGIFIKETPICYKPLPLGYIFYPKNKDQDEDWDEDEDQGEDEKLDSQLLLESLKTHEAKFQSKIAEFQSKIVKPKSKIVKTPEVYWTYLILYKKDRGYYFFTGYMSSFNNILRGSKITTIFKLKLKNATTCLSELRHIARARYGGEDDFRIRGNHFFPISSTAFENVKKIMDRLAEKYG
ncbi:hypothetical protein DLEV_174 [Diachasmimorpha longicaudata entomopoxvirus]|uniref:Uncharacterized protein n=1 Tax=Diachasmimorpha longicaudata entomopoxvirus TaxID=109981 RepID=A0A7R5WFG9_9POXV|nr:hypothetical protein QKK69_gp174 [Diachasmimorpha longicaudata entomopoxvirus]AKS26465.1 hypothetical protein DLEV_174 [Diachasmimorpha longicaudata entomopoxvirus]